MSQELRETIAKWARQRRPAPREPLGLDPCCPFAALLEQRLQSLAEEVKEMKTRLYGLIFVVLGAVVVEVLLRLAR